jgi:K+-transporting ATPase KdpF subunit
MAMVVSRNDSRWRRRAAREGLGMELEYVVGGLVAVLLMVYLFVALLRPERF